MRLKWITAVMVLAIAVLGYLAWRNNTQPATQETAAAPPEGAPAAEAPADPGIAWNAPASWTDEGSRPMRLASYVVSGPGGEAQCAVHYFGPGQGGTPEANLDRWLGEFQDAKDPQRSVQTVNGLRVSRARARGAYQSHGGSEQPGASQGGQELIGAIVEGPQGPVFFKLTGPSVTVSAAAADFDRMIASVREK
jgi:hypothetical protein